MDLWVRDRIPTASRTDEMQFSSMKPSSERRLDAEELIQWVLPCCTIRPRVYNQISKLTREVQNEADELAQREAREEGEEYIPFKRSSFVMYMPTKNLNYTMVERKLDLALLTDLLSVQRRVYVTTRLEIHRNSLEQEIKSLEKSMKDAVRNRVKERSLMLQTFTSALLYLQDRPNLYNQVCAHIAMVVEDHSDVHLQLIPMAIPQETEGHSLSSQEYWKDVQRLDEIIDVLMDGSFVKAAFETMKLRAVAEAKAMQKMEAERLSNPRDYPQYQMALLEDVPLSH